MKSNEAILDTSVVLSLYHLGLLPKLNLLYNVVHVPEAVESEFLNWNSKVSSKEQRLSALLLMYENHSIWFKKCNNYESDTVLIYSSEKDIDLGEAEVFAQHQAHDSLPIVVIDEKKARRFAESRSINKSGSLRILAQFNNLGIEPGYHAWIEELKRLDINRFSKTLVESVYKEYCLKR